MQLRLLFMLLIAAAISFPANVQSDAEPPSIEDEDVLTQVFLISRTIHKHPETMQAIMLVESKGVEGAVGNKNGPLTQRSFGVMQLQLIAARDVLERNPLLTHQFFNTLDHREVSNQRLADVLTNNTQANITIAAHLFKHYLKTVGGDLSKAVTAYNVGIGRINTIDPSTHYYHTAVAKKLRTVQHHNKVSGVVTQR